ncbi:aminopeptidase P family protein [Candidatus Marinimicrobia bacterium]|nr:aminopeptidase P family protein [Candidatus Neomarinimicrobiota bacterium]MDA9841272.1 aminopeptidase P family protein [Candidatus Neomarinimicrobiota bacterium]MDB3980430.1 aminopeptidase P family protein [Candidatus Neomarinimicrobiota bacterium]MDC0521659.1 aminopeptidase P family protein [Candidatus Neomarinimicrobiota bacterium]MDC0654118.1 aminopeptidase P family protein [Candidatus Neomarinimicrobiota bacterium]|tara:strand:+ start:311 stop:1399 length:1089 start_codon:yes stop_codon:yes gene_type:complete
MSAEYFIRRQDKLRTVLAEKNVDGMLITNMIHIKYLCGFGGSSGSLLVGLDNSEFITDGRYVVQSKNEVRGANITIDSIPHLQVIKNKNFLSSGQTIGFDGKNVSHQMFSDISNILPHVKWENIVGCVETLAMEKDKKEIEALKTAVEITDKAFAEVFPMIKIGVEEQEIANQLSFLYRKYGDADADAFSPIVGSGPHSAMPHQRPTDKKIGPGELVVIDSGAKYAGYHADMTRTVATKGYSEQQKEIYDIVLEAQLKSIQGIKAGASCKAIDTIARAHITNAGYGKYFDHGLGHSLGLEIHEDPRFSKVSTDSLKSNYVMTVEPGIYIEDVGGVRIEDDIVVTDDGHIVLNKTSKDFTVIS